ncbi:hypothetical protein OIO90_001047 [Microbotryomycetes sp. JL221]|nr:hypothetical protein OIO90_001047 [Microbotryomycetes sp. JL221]
MSDSEDERPTHERAPFGLVDSLHSLGGGSSSFRMFGHHHGSGASAAAAAAAAAANGHSTASSLPAPPAPFEEFQYTSNFDFGRSPPLHHRLPAGASPVDPLSPPQPATTFTSMFDNTTQPPPTYGNVYTQPTPYQYQQQQQQQTRQRAQHNGYYPSPVPPSSSFISPPPHSPRQPSSTSLYHGLNHNDHPTQSTSLFDDSESALFSSFLNTLDVDPNFLFNPILPPEMPSPPSHLLDEESAKERENLSFKVDEIDLDQQQSQQQRITTTTTKGQQRVEYDLDQDVKPVVSQTPLQTCYQDEQDEDEGIESDPVDDTRADPDFNVGNNNKSSNTLIKKTRSNMDNGQGGTLSKKIKFEQQQQQDDLDDDEKVHVDGDVDMQLDDDDSLSTRTRTTTARRGGAGRGGGGKEGKRSSTTTTTSRTTRPSLKAREAAVSNDDEQEQDDQLAEDNQQDHLQEEEDELAEGEQDTIETLYDRNKTNLSENQKRSNHIQSEQKRRNAIKNGFKDLVDLLSSGEQASGIVVAPPEFDPFSTTTTNSKKRKKTKGTGRGRGRRGEVGAGASKSVVLEKATQYILWLERGNQGLDEEIERVESHLNNLGIQVP